MSKRIQLLIVCLALIAVTLIAFWRLNYCGFTNYDETDYVTENLHIQEGISFNGIKWAFTTGYVGNWHPLTWISHMLDIDLFGLQPRGHHLMNLFFHIANTLLLFLVLHRMTKRLWQSAFVAALFALHPLHVESVAWAAERKDVLSSFFWMLTLGAYAFYVERPAFWRYVPVFLFFISGLMSKPMLVTLPFVLLLLDYWPLGRLAQETTSQKMLANANKSELAATNKKKSRKKHRAVNTLKTEKSAEKKYQQTPIRFLLLEKAPLFALVVLSSFITYAVQRQAGAVSSTNTLTLSARIANASVSYILYMIKMIWPIHLAVLYPYSESLPLWEVLGTVLLLIALTFMVIRKRKQCPYLTTGWLWYAGTLVPVIGIVQVGIQAMADRYTYVPLIGLFIMAAWGFPELIKNWRYRKEALMALPVLILFCLSILTWRHVGYWQNSITLYTHTLNVTTNNFLIYGNRGAAYNLLGNYTEAIKDFNKAIEINPRFADAYRNRGAAYSRMGQYTEAIVDFDKAISIRPGYAEAYDNRGAVYGSLGNYTEANRNFSKTIEINPEYTLAYYNRGLTYIRTGNYLQAINDFNRAIEINPRYAEAYHQRGVVSLKLGNYNQAIADFDRVIEMFPKYADVYNNRGIAYGSLGNYTRAIENFDKAIEINPGYTEARQNREFALQQKKRRL